jgi:hypothetical protein
MRRVAAGLVVVALACAFLAGYWPQREALARANEQLAETRRLYAAAEARAAAAEMQLRLARVFGPFLALRDAAAAGNYGEAQGLSSSFFDQIRDLAAASRDPAVRAALGTVLDRRDPVTAGLARGEASVREVLLPIERELRAALGYPVPAPALAQPPSAGAPPGAP